MQVNELSQLSSAVEQTLERVTLVSGRAGNGASSPHSTSQRSRCVFQILSLWTWAYEYVEVE